MDLCLNFFTLQHSKHRSIFTYVCFKDYFKTKYVNSTIINHWLGYISILSAYSLHHMPTCIYYIPIMHGITQYIISYIMGCMLLRYHNIITSITLYHFYYIIHCMIYAYCQYILWIVVWYYIIVLISYNDEIIILIISWYVWYNAYHQVIWYKTTHVIIYCAMHGIIIII